MTPTNFDTATFDGTPTYDAGNFDTSNFDTSNFETTANFGNELAPTGPSFPPVSPLGVPDDPDLN